MELEYFKKRNAAIEALAELQSFVAIYRRNFSGFKQTRANIQYAENPCVH